MPVDAIALALDIIEVRKAPLANLEGALITHSERDRGLILVNSGSNRQRRRYTTGHELLHFLNPTHRPTSPDGFHCSRFDMLRSDLDDKERHHRQEAEANCFSIELLAPPRLVGPFLRGAPDLGNVVAMASSLDLSREASARRYIELHSETLAALFSKDGRLVYSRSSRDFPSLVHSRGDLLPAGPDPRTGPLSGMEVIEADDWLFKPAGLQLSLQTLSQQDGRAITLLWLVEDEEPDGVEDSFSRFSRA